MRSIPDIKDIPTAVRIFYSKDCLGTADIEELFDCCRATAIRIKKIAADYMKENNIISRNDWTVDTDAAYLAWRLDIDRMERKLKKLQKLEAYL